MKKQIVVSPVASRRLASAAHWLVARGRSERVLIIGSAEATSHLSRSVARDLGSSFGWERLTLGRVAGALAGPALAARGLTPVGALPLEALCARLVHVLGASLGRFVPIAERPGLPRALMRTLDELRLAALGDPEKEPLEDEDLARLLAAYSQELTFAKLADRACVLALAADAANDASCSNAVLGIPLLLLDTPVANVRERDLVAALARCAGEVLATVPEGDDRTLLHLRDAMSTTDARPDAGDQEVPGLTRLQSRLFSVERAMTADAAGEEMEILSAPGESRECVEIARRMRKESERGTPFDAMAILLRSPLQYRAHVEEALRRASIPAYFARGTVRPDPTGRAFLALLACAADGLSARRFAEYLSLGEVADATENGAPPPAAASGDRWVPPEVDLIPEAIARAGAAPEETSDAATSPRPEVIAVLDGTLRTPRRWERLLVESAVIGGLDRWTRRLEALRKELEQKEATNPEPADADRIRRDLSDLEALRGYALPLLEAMSALPKAATWEKWLDSLSALATRSLRQPDRVLAVLAELDPMNAIGPVELSEVRMVLERRLSELVVRPTGRRSGHVYIASIEEARGLSFEVVFIPGLAEKIFPQKVSQDPILPDAARKKIGRLLPTNDERAAEERLALRIATGAATKRLVFSYPRLDMEQSRPRTPSFYGLEVLRAAEGKLPGFDELARRAETVGAARLGWPAPARSVDAIDEAEHDLALLESLFKRPEADTVGTARYLLSANAHLARALRFRANRWLKKFTYADGIVEPHAEAKAALAKHTFEARSFSPTALQNYAACPYRFVLQAIHRLSAREEPAPLEELDPLQRGSLIHDVLFKFYGKLRAAGQLPVTVTNFDAALATLEQTLDEEAERYKDDLAPAIERVWQDGITSIKSDLREFLRLSKHDTTWVPAYFELAFGLPPDQKDKRDPRSDDQPLELSVGMKLRGSIDLIERRADGALRATDYKTGKKRVKGDLVIGGGQTLQPVFYALAAEKLFPGERIDSGRLYFCTSAGEFEPVDVAFDAGAREAAAAVVSTIGRALSESFLPAAPAKGACQYCDYLRVCGPYEEHRTSKVKKQDKLLPLVQLRRRP